MEAIAAALPTLGLGWLALAAVMAALWLLQRRTGDAAVVDVAWAGGLACLAILVAATGDGDPGRRAALGILAALPFLRLAVHLLRDRILSGTEDGRYTALRARWGQSFQPRVFWFFQAQALLAALLVAPFAVVAAHDAPLGSAADAAALGLWTIALVGEAIADRQLARFRHDPANRGRTCRAGLWGVSRHPNYFFQWLLWFVQPLLALGAPGALLTLLPPAVMLALIVKVTGIPPTEIQALKSRGDDYRAYQRTTSPFIPWFPKEIRS